MPMYQQFTAYFTYEMDTNIIQSKSDLKQKRGRGAVSGKLVLLSHFPFVEKKIHFNTTITVCR